MAECITELEPHNLYSEIMFLLKRYTVLHNFTMVAERINTPLVLPHIPE